MEKSNVEFVILIEARIALIVQGANPLYPLLEIFAYDNFQIKNILILYVTETGNGGLNLKINGESLTYRGEYLVKYKEL